MAVYTVEPLRNQRISTSGSKDKLTTTIQIDYQVEVTDVDPKLIDIVDMLNNSVLPKTNQTVWTAPDNSWTDPFMVCRDVKLEQDKKKLTRFVAKTTWKSEFANESQTQPPPNAVTDITPREDVDLGEVQLVIYEDKTSPDPQRIATPSGEEWADPVFERIPTLNLRITQYEAGITYQQMLDRKFKVNDATYRTQPRYSWLITQVEASQVNVVLAGGPTAAALVVYHLAFNNLTQGWKDKVALIDKQWRPTVDDPFQAFLEGELKTQTVGLVTSDGLKKPVANPPAPPTLPDYVEYETFDEIDFSSFLQV